MSVIYHIPYQYQKLLSKLPNTSARNPDATVKESRRVIIIRYMEANFKLFNQKVIRPLAIDKSPDLFQQFVQKKI